MSYCVNCGVELDAEIKSCPLCGVKVINPLAPEATGASSYPKKIDEFKQKDRRFWIIFITVILATPAATCIIGDLLITHKLTWSVFVTAGVFLLWVASTSPLYFKKFSIIKMLFIDICATVLFLFIIEASTGGKGWIVPIALPVCGYVLISGLIIAYLYHHHNLSGLGIASAVLISAGFMLPGLEAIIDLYNNAAAELFWSWLVTASCLSAATLLIILNNSKRFRTALQKRLHF